MKAIRDKATGKLTFKINKDKDDSPESKFGKELQKSAQAKKNEEFSKEKKIESGLNKNLSLQPEKKSRKVSEHKIVFDN